MVEKRLRALLRLRYRVFEILAFSVSEIKIKKRTKIPSFLQLRLAFYSLFREFDL